MEHSYKYINKYSKAKFHIPAFMIISFYFYYNTLKSKSIIKIYLRFQRILIPYIIFPTFIFIINNLLFSLFGYSQYNKILLLKYLLYQLILGSVYHTIFYYQFNLILFTILFTIIIFIFRKSSIFIFQILLIIGYILQYNYWNFYFFKKYISFVNISLGHISELIPFAVTGLTFGYLDIITKTKKTTGLSIFYCISIIILTLKFEINKDNI
jgi:fucose 4-O-acetylase-like acetyltransferase